MAVTANSPRLASLAEEERKYEVGASFALPELGGCLPAGGQVVDRGPVTLTATYYDTADLRLARTGASLRYRWSTRGSGSSERTWTVKLPSGLPGVRHEISRAGQAGRPPDELVVLVTATTRGAELRPVVVLRSRRHRYELCDADGTVLAELADDTVSVLDGLRARASFREIEVELVKGDRRLLDRVEVPLVQAGAVAGIFTPKQVRALGEAAAGAPDLPAPAALGRKPRGGDVVTEAIRRSVSRIVAHDPLVRLRQELPGGDTPVHQMRVGCRRLRSDLRTFRPLVDRQWAGGLRDELRWLAQTLGTARDAEVLRARLDRIAALDPLAPLDPSAVARIDAELAVRQHEALETVAAALRSDRYVALLNALVDAAKTPRLTPLAGAAAREVLPGLVSRPWYRLAKGSRGVSGAADLAPDAPDAEWHAVRVNGKRARYAVEAVADAIGGAAPRLSRRLAVLQDLLGEHQDAAVAAQTWLAIAASRSTASLASLDRSDASDPDDHALAVAAGRLYERERAAIRRVRAEFPNAWRRANRGKLLAWLP
jgi:CHAD domain-containing protein